MVAVDTNFLVLAIRPKHVTDDEHRARHLIECIKKKRARLVIPMQALAEYLVKTDIASQTILEQMERKAFVVAAPFDRMSATECSQLNAAAIGRGDKKDGAERDWQRIKVDRQIVAVAKANGAGMLVSNDKGVRNNAMRVGIHAVRIEELPLPDDIRQGKLRLVKGKSEK